MVIRVGITAAMWNGDPSRAICNGRPIDYLEQSLAQFIAGHGALAYLIPSFGAKKSKLQEYVSDLDALVLQGGEDVCPESYGEKPMRSEWKGDAKRDACELLLIEAAVALGKPILGICRGMQILNVAFGGSLYQDIHECLPNAHTHRDDQLYEKNEHQIDIISGGLLSQIYPGVVSAKINSVHHQAIRDLAPGFLVEARSSGDGIVEAISKNSDLPKGAPCLGVQWHPEFHSQPNLGLLESKQLLESFIQSAVIHKAKSE